MTNNLLKNNGFSKIWALVGLVILLAIILWAYLPSLSEMADRWQHDPQYSQGFIVPLFAGFLLWYRREYIPAGLPQYNPWGLLLLAGGLALYLGGMAISREWLVQVSLLPVLAGTCLLIAGWQSWKWALPSIGFLFFMMPLPTQVEGLVTHPLQRVATIASTFVMQMVGLPAISEGNVIVVDDAQIGVVEACSGLSMMMLFVALSVALVLVIQRGLIDQVVLLVSAIPIALIANVIRITVTGILVVTAGSKIANEVYHTLAGLLMMPLALGLLGLELFVLSRLFIEVKGDPIKPQAMPGASPVRKAQSRPTAKTSRR